MKFFAYRHYKKLLFVFIFWTGNALSMEETSEHSKLNPTQRVIKQIKKVLKRIESKDGILDFSNILREEGLDELMQLLNNYPESSQLCKELKEILSSSKSCISTTEKMLKRFKQELKGNLKNKTSDVGKEFVEEKIDQLVAFFNDNPECLQMLKESAFEKESLKTRVARFISALPENVWYQCRGAFGGFSGACLLMMFINALYPDTLCEIAPQGVTASVAIPALLFICAKTYSLLELPAPFTKIIIAKTFNLATSLAPAFVTASRIDVNTEVTEEIQKSYHDLVASLTEEQKSTLSARYILLRAQLDPLILLNEIEFLNSLTKKQLPCAYIYLSQAIPDAINSNFEAFAEEVTQNQLKALKPKNKLLLASFNPKILFAESNQKFLELLSKQQIEQLTALSFQ